MRWIAKMSASATSAFCPPDSCCMNDDGWFVVNDTCDRQTRVGTAAHERSTRRRARARLDSDALERAHIAIHTRAGALRDLLLLFASLLRAQFCAPARARRAVCWCETRTRARPRGRAHAHHDGRGAAGHELLEDLLEVLRDALERAKQVLVLAEVQRLSARAAPGDGHVTHAHPSSSGRARSGARQSAS